MLLIGGEGQLGSDILRNNTCHQILAPTHAKLDVQLRENVESFVHQFSPEIIVNCAAFHNVPNCEFAPELAFRINCIAVRDLAEICRKLDIPLVTFSSDYVFGGDQRKPYGEASCPAPVQVYGMTRLAGEHAARALAPNHAVIVRTCGLYGMAVSRSKGGNFVDQRIAEARVNEQIEISCEQIVSPTSSDDLSKAVLGLIEHSEREPGIYHLVNEGKCSWYEFTVAIFEELNLETKVIPIDRKGLSGEMRRPLYSVLGNIKAKALGITLPPWRDALRRYLQAKYPESFN